MTVKYMLLINNNPATLEALSEDQRTALMTEVDDLMSELARTGELVGGEALADASHSKTVRVRGGVPATTDGPFVEAKEYLAGYLIIDAENVERAVEIAARWPDAQYGAMEVRPIMDAAGLEM
ncbi:YciI family protein [Longispora sp. K20-0274]|uniref:YciI family protein n=1 Tax=Longispora sp. K20-0274 TaxID=3088255 RepID=UPI00399B17FC